MKFLLASLLIGGSLQAAPPYKTQASQTFKVVIDDLQDEMENHEVELRMFEERLNTQENIIDSLRQQLLDVNLANQELVKGNSVSLESKIMKMESDMKTLQGHSNETSKILTQYKKKIGQLEMQIQNLKEAVTMLADVLKVEPKHAEYTVQAGDTLEKIARRHKTTVAKIKELNGLSKDKIFIGQKLRL